MHVKKLLKLCVALVIVIFLITTWIELFVEKQGTHEAAPSETKFIKTTTKEEIAYRETSASAGQSIVFIGGLSGWSGTWQRTIDELEKKLGKGAYNLIALDLPPFGYSTADLSRGFSREVQAQRIQEFVTEKKLSNITFVAHSYGAGPVTEAVMTADATLKSKIRKLIVIDGVLNIDEVKEVKSNSIINPFTLEIFVKLFSHSTFVVKNRLTSFVYNTDHLDTPLAERYMQPFSVEGNSKRLAYWIQDYMRDPLKVKSAQSDSYKKLYIPVRIIWGEKDTLTPVALGNKLADYVPLGKKFVLPDVGHIPMIEDYAQFDRALFRAVTE